REFCARNVGDNVERYQLEGTRTVRPRYEHPQAVWHTRRNDRGVSLGWHCDHEYAPFRESQYEYQWANVRSHLRSVFGRLERIYNPGAVFRQPRIRSESPRQLLRGSDEESNHAYCCNPYPDDRHRRAEQLGLLWSGSGRHKVLHADANQHE